MDKSSARGITSNVIESTDNVRLIISTYHEENKRGYGVDIKNIYGVWVPVKEYVTDLNNNRSKNKAYKKAYDDYKSLVVRYGKFRDSIEEDIKEGRRLC